MSKLQITNAQRKQIQYRAVTKDRQRIVRALWEMFPGSERAMRDRVIAMVLRTNTAKEDR